MNIEKDDFSLVAYLSYKCLYMYVHMSIELYISESIFISAIYLYCLF